eukprot:gb/GEZN01003109.1/.p1 GENE.gb/GEZN01003109.1/~~gb/GEZN01003109.1/.p1  ORF type:complete len:744 (+),score=44.97 gb/GEZN01003109.1/:184-2232(+)
MSAMAVTTEGNRSRNVFQMTILDSSGNPLNMSGLNLKQPLRIAIPHDFSEFGCTERTCDVYGSESQAAASGVSQETYRWLTSGCVYNLDESTVNMTICYCDSLAGGTVQLGGGGAAGNPASDDEQIGTESLLTWFSVNRVRFKPRLNKLYTEDFTRVTVENIQDNPLGIILVGAVTAVYLVIFTLAWRSMTLDRVKLTRSNIEKTKDRWAQEYIESQRGRGLIPFLKQWYAVLLDQHLWLSSVVHKYGESFNQPARATVLFITVLMQMSTAAIFYGRQTPESGIAISVFSAVVAGGVSELFRFVFSNAGPMRPRDEFKYQVMLKRARFLGNPDPKRPYRLPNFFRILAWLLAFLVFLASLLLVLVYSLRFDLTHASAVTWDDKKSFKLNGLILEEACSTFAACQEKCSVEPACNGVTVRVKDEYCNLLRVDGNPEVDSRFLGAQLHELYKGSLHWAWACLVAAMIDCFLGRPVSCFGKALYIQIFTIKIPLLALSNLQLKGLNSVGAIYGESGHLPASSPAKVESRPAVLSAFPGDHDKDEEHEVQWDVPDRQLQLEGSPLRTNDVPMVVDFGTEEREPSGGSLWNKINVGRLRSLTNDSELSELEAVDECPRCGALLPLRTDGESVGQCQDCGALAGPSTQSPEQRLLENNQHSQERDSQDLQERAIRGLADIGLFLSDQR